jgi:hypothetical protein
MIPIDVWLNDTPPFAIEELEIEPWFPYGMDQQVIKVVPGTTHNLASELVIFTNACDKKGMPNKALASNFKLGWLGNVIVAKRSKKDNYSVVHIRSHDTELVNAVVYQ